MKRKQEFFLTEDLKHKEVIANPPKQMYPQERDWTCAIACIRTMLSGILEEVPSEELLLEKYRLIPGPHYSRDVKSYGILDAFDAIYGCDLEDYNFDTVLDYMNQGYYIMLESMQNYAHWMVLLGYYPLDGGTTEQSRILMYDPYYNHVRLINTDEFISMWRDGNFENTRVDKDFIAVKA